MQAQISSLSHAILALLHPFSILFSKPSWKESLTLFLGTLICTGKPKVCSALRVMGLSGEVGFSKYRHLLNRATWSSLQAAKILFFMLVAFIGENAPVVLFIDETLERRKRPKIKAKGYYRDAVRSSKSQLVKASGLKWLVMAISIQLPFMKRAFALPFLTVLEYSKKHDSRVKKQHKTTLDWAGQMTG